MKSADRIKKEKEFEEIVNSASPEKLKKIKFIVEYVTNATPAEMAVLKEQMKCEDFGTDDWIETQILQAVSREKGVAVHV